MFILFFWFREPSRENNKKQKMKNCIVFVWVHKNKRQQTKTVQVLKTDSAAFTPQKLAFSKHLSLMLLFGAVTIGECSADRFPGCADRVLLYGSALHAT